MKQSAAKTLGVAALGAAFAAAAAGTASAAPANLPDSATSLDTVTSVAPVQEALTKLPAGVPESLAGGQTALTSSLADSPATLPATVQAAATKVLPGADGADPVSGLLGGLPVGAGSLPVGGGVPGLPGLPGLGG
ncbi:ATP-binding protein [Streptomyces sp. NPDC005408]|uniref:ATP-binding protein n=1 Tax=Streptomyces sp. NPDC005408 TaxID=3155341 RepID=UPI0033B0B10F